MITVYKYHFHIAGDQTIRLPFAHVIRHVGLDPKGTPAIWAEIDTEMPIKEHKLFIVGTGHMLPSNHATYLGTFTLGQHVWHLYLD